jgi:hypothetical protein
MAKVAAAATSLSQALSRVLPPISIASKGSGLRQVQRDRNNGICLRPLPLIASHDHRVARETAGPPGGDGSLWSEYRAWISPTELRRYGTTYMTSK